MSDEELKELEGVSVPSAGKWMNKTDYRFLRNKVIYHITPVFLA